MNNNIIYFSKIRDNAIIPSKRDEDSGFDFYPSFEEEEIQLNPGDIKLIPTGIATAFSAEYVMFIKERSSTGANGMSTRMGVIDSGFRGEIVIGLNNTSNIPIIISKNIGVVTKSNASFLFPYTKAIAQGVLCVIPSIQVEEIAYNDLILMRSHRGTSFLGASGK